MENAYDLVVIGSGPGGYVAAIRASQLGKRVAVIERESIGGICLNWGCIPTKALLKSAGLYNQVKEAAEYGVMLENPGIHFENVINRSRDVAEKMSKGVEFLFRKNKITLIKGSGRMVENREVVVTDKNGNQESFTAAHIIIATGARAKELPNLPIDNHRIIGYRLALSMKTLPSRLVVVGGGAIGVEFAYFFRSMGSEVTLVEYLEQGLLPREDIEVSKSLARSFKKQGIRVMAPASIEGVEKRENDCLVKIRKRSDDAMEEMEADMVLSAVGIVPNTENLGLETLGVNLENGFIRVDEFYRTNVPGVYAIGDVIQTPALAHVASAEGIICVEHIFGMSPSRLDYVKVPSNTYCQPEVASVGLTEEAARNAGHEIRVGKFPFTASGKASAAGENEGFIKLIFDSKYGGLLGAHMIGAHVTELIGELVLGSNLETTGKELFKTIHPHPTLSEAIMEAAADAWGEAIHI